MKSLFARIVNTWEVFAAMTIMVLRGRESRRKLMFVVSLMAMFLTFLGIVVLDAFLLEHVVLFLAYWCVCGALVFLMLLLAIYDMARVRVEVREEAMRRLGEALHEIEDAHADAGNVGEEEGSESRR